MSSPGSADELLVSTIARHFPEARVVHNTVELGFGGVTIGCRTGAINPFAGVESAELFFTLAGDDVRGPIELMMTSYAESEQHAIVQGGCQWACSFGPVLTAALSDEAREDVEYFEIDLGGHALRAYVDTFDQVLHFAAGGEDTSTARARLGGDPWFVPAVVGGVGLVPDRIQIVSMFVGELPDKRILEVKVDGVARKGFDHLVTLAAAAPISQMVLLRELCVIVPD